MEYNAIRHALNAYYFEQLPAIAEEMRQTVFQELDTYAAAHPDANAYELKRKQYEVITEHLQPRLFEGLPFFFETGALVAWSDGRYDRGAIHANAWLYLRNSHLFEDMDPYAYGIYKKHQSNTLYTQCGIYADMMHQGLPLKKVFQVGLRGILQELEAADATCQNAEEADFIACATAGIRALCRLAEKFATAARAQGLEELAQVAERVPYNPPDSVYEGLCTLAFIRKGLGSLEGMGYSSFGRVDVLLAPLYDKDMQRGISRESLLDLVTRFLLIWDCTMNRNDKLFAAEYELENSLTLGGCDADGNPVFNDITKLFLEARDRESILYPKMMLRFSENSPKEYLEMIGDPLIRSRSFSLYANDDAVIPALVASGIEVADARQYAVGGCWDILLPDLYIHNSGEYFNVLAPLLWSIHRYKQPMQECNIFFEPLEEVGSFEELYTRYLGGVRRIAVQKAALQSRGARVWHRVNPLGAMSALMEPCIPKKRDITAGAGKYNSEVAYFILFAETADTLLAIRKLCFEDKVCSLDELFAQCRQDWADEALRQQALRAPSYGDGSAESGAFVGRLVDDLCELFDDLPTAYGGRFRVGSNTYTEVVWMRGEIPAMPNGRRRGDFISQGLTPDRTGRSTSLYDILDAFRYIDTKKLTAGASLTLTLPTGGMDINRAVEFFRMLARSGALSIQPNCVRREDLLAAQKDPASYGHIIVRVCGFSAPFVLLPPIYQQEVLTRTLAEV